ncbi:C4-dicarboxylate ABC transporter permease [Notoacmeibacter marinus]|uniref:C4-dicarboxylate ABC transporter permease n=1 Tax=Notoacmeibacter marinus TaxID=1876515 RepID=A0A231V442_9HYPH|nr:TRAP transporter large permease [Notoacmeibacter marinus]OXT02336.1 C4-dicarboxylate ABC transporter permease [Notoacmeibacter marinus]
MEPIEIGIAVTAGLLLVVILGMRVAFAAAIAGLVGLIWIFWSKKGYAPDQFGWAFTVAAKTAGQVPHSKVASQALSLIPTFILIGYLAYYAGLTRALFEAAKRWMGWVPGGLAVSTIFATAGFSAVSGASVATSAVFARIAIPEMLKVGYDKRFAAGVVAAGGTLASLIPPSAILVIYAIIVEQDVGMLLLAGFLPGMVSAVIYAGLVIALAMTIKGFGPPVGGYSWRQRLAAVPATLPIFVVVAVIILFVYNPFGGAAWGTPTEGGAIGAFVVFCMAVYRGMRWPELKKALIETAKLSVMIFSIIWGVLIFVRFLGFAQLPTAFADWIGGLEQSPWITLILILLAYAVLGMFMDAIGMMLLTLPVVYPAVMALNGGAFVSAEESAFGMNGVLCGVWFGILVVKMAELCLITPPIGLNCFVVAGVRDDISVQDVFRGASPFFVADALTIATLLAFPAIVLWLPRLAMGN